MSLSSPVGRYMNLYLSSYRLGERGAELAAMVGKRKHFALVRNAADAWDDAERHRLGLERERDALADIGITSSPLDLRDYFSRERVADASFTYGGYSAGACVLAPTLRGIHFADEPEVLPPGYRGEVPWEGVGILPRRAASRLRFAPIGIWRRRYE